MTQRLLWRRVRGLVGTSIMWGGAWALAGVVIGGVFWLSGASVFSLTGPRWLWVWAEVGAVTGAVSGGVFSLAVMTLERRGDFGVITPFRFGVLGAVTAGLVTAIGFAEPLLFGLIGAAIGFFCGSGSVIVARRALSAPRSTVSSLPPAA
jgi:hypothetical protein